MQVYGDVRGTIIHDSGVELHAFLPEATSRRWVACITALRYGLAAKAHAHAVACNPSLQLTPPCCCRDVELSCSSDEPLRRYRS